MSNFNLGTSFGMSNVIIPRGGPKCVPAKLDFGATPEIEIDGELIVAQGHIEYLQGVYIDNADNPTPFSLIMGLTGQRITAAPNSQGYYAILAPNPPRMIATTTQAANRTIQLFFYNVPIQSQTWLTV